MNKNDAAIFLGIGVRSLERYTSEGRLPAQKFKGKTGAVLDYDETQLARFKAELETPINVGKVVDDPTPASSSPKSRQTPPPSAATSLAIVPKTSKDLARVTSQDTREAKILAEPVQVAAKLLLTLPEAQILTGLSRSPPRPAINNGTLKAARIGNAWRVRRGDLEAYLDGLY